MGGGKLGAAALRFFSVACLAVVIGRVSASDLDAPNDSAPGRVTTAHDGWVAGAVRDEIRPKFAHEPQGGPDGHAALVIQADNREGLDGFWKRDFAVIGGKSYRFRASYRATRVVVPRLSVVAELRWRDAKGREVPRDEPSPSGYLRARPPWLRPSSPRRGRPTSMAGPRSPITIRPPRGDAGNRRVALAVGADAEVRWSARR